MRTFVTMRLESIEAFNFRNLSGRLEFDSRLNVISGDNGQGKTNWLEAIHVLSTARSFKTAKLSEALKFGEDLGIVKGYVRQSEDIVHELQVAIQGATKTLSVNGKKESLQRYLSELNAVNFNSDELEIIRGNPEARRKFIDRGITAIFPPFVQTLADYGKVMRQKNSLLQSASERNLSVEQTALALEPWNEQLVGLASRIYKARVRFIERLSEVLQKRLFGREEVSIRYACSLEGKGDLSDYPGLLAERLKLRTQAELSSGHCLIGPHRDDLDILFDGHDIRRFGSSGQQRSALLVLLLATLNVYHSQHGEYPLFLIDDIDAELDYRRIGQLLEFLSDKTQTFVTTSKESFLEKFGGSGRILPITNGSLAA